MWRTTLCRFLAIGALACVGCGASDGTFPVSGRLQTTSGDAIESAQVMFVSDAGKTHSASVDQDGAFRLSSGSDASGLAPGNYKVVVQESSLDDIDAPAKPKAHQKYRSRETTDLQVTVQEGDNVFNLALDTPK